MNEHDRILEAVLVGDKRPQDPDVRAHLEACEECRGRLPRLSNLAQNLDRFAREDREDLDAAHGAPAEVVAPFEEVLRRVRSGEDEREVDDESPARRLRPRRGRWFLTLAAAAAVLLLVLLADRFLDSEDVGPDPDVFLGDGREIVMIEPAEPRVDSYGRFRWECDLPEGGRYLLQIFDDTPEARGTLLLPARTFVDTNEWSPDDAILPLTLPRAIRVRLVALDAAGAELGTGEWRFERSSP